MYTNNDNFFSIIDLFEKKSIIINQNGMIKYLVNDIGVVIDENEQITD